MEDIQNAQVHICPEYGIALAGIGHMERLDA